MSTNLRELIHALERERHELEAALATLRVLADMRESRDIMPLNPRSRRGRKFMGADERKQVSERMKKYWAGRRKAKGATS